MHPETPEAAKTGGRRGTRLLAGLLVLIPIAAVLAATRAMGAVVFLAAILAMVPLAGFLGRATEEIALRSSPALASLFNATFGNAIELMIAAQILVSSDPDGPRIVRASIVGSIVTNLLLVVGASMLGGGFKYHQQKFNREAAGVSSSLLIIAFAGVSIPTLHAEFVSAGRQEVLSAATSVVLAVVYACGILFTFRTHRHLFDTTDEVRQARHPEWSVRQALAVLAGSLVAAAYLSHLLATTLSAAGRELGLSKIFVGVILIGAVTNVAENLAAIFYARQNLVDISIQIGTSSAIQILLFVAPLLVWIGALTGHPLTLHFTLFELGAMLLPVMITNHLAGDGVCNWLEGALLLALYALLGTAFFFVS